MHYALPPPPAAAANRHTAYLPDQAQTVRMRTNNATPHTVIDFHIIIVLHTLKCLGSKIDRVVRHSGQR